MQNENIKATKEVESTVSEKTRQETEAQEPGNWLWVEAAVWTVRMLAALVNGVKGGKWFSLMDKVYAPTTLQIAWQRVKSNKGAAGIDRRTPSDLRDSLRNICKNCMSNLKQELTSRKPLNGSISLKLAEERAH